MIVPPALLSILEGTKRVTTLARIDWSLVFEHSRQTLFARRPNLCIRRVSPSFGGSMRRIARYRVSGRVRDRQPTTIPPLAYIASWYHKLRGEEEVQVFAGNSSISFQPKGCVCGCSPLARVSTKLWIYIPVATSKGMPSGLVMRHGFHSVRFAWVSSYASGGCTAQHGCVCRIVLFYSRILNSGYYFVSFVRIGFFVEGKFCFFLYLLMNDWIGGEEFFGEG